MFWGSRQVYIGQGQRGRFSRSNLVYVPWVHVKSIKAESHKEATYTVSPKRNDSLLSSWVLKTEEVRWKVGGPKKPIIELVQTGLSFILNFKNKAWSSLDQLNGGSGASPTFPLAPSILSSWLCRKCILSFDGDCTVITMGVSCDNAYAHMKIWQCNILSQTLRYNVSETILYLHYGHICCGQPWVKHMFWKRTGDGLCGL